ncbi:hypothetical protein [Nocardioides sp. cx-173]|uniref:hypothetical protein n=1 Tax=Nocardioides sp. cx-173 TaxID=2898796 RepID=UPI001E3A7ECE|nr:hypothetical protein [Nocardioides sp. cx-173]MCD4524969.1 hypothetical protein [Nocardioides sp. cx-173]UGB40322.1 hypothetical protein LQ940_13100 [Nocardioides sp. cx-173]
MNRTVLIAIGVVVVVAAVVIGGWLILRDDAGGTTRERGDCGPVSYELSVEKDDGQLEVSYELTSESPDETWRIVVEQGDAVLLEGERRTDSDAELDVDVAGDENGSDTFIVTATPASGEVCVARLTR